MDSSGLQADDNPQPLIAAVQALQDLIESDATIFMHVSSMFEQVPRTEPHDRDPLGRHQPRDYGHMLRIMNRIATSAPKWDIAVCKAGWLGFPLNVVLNWPMSTPSGKAFFLNEKVNVALKMILDSWAGYLSSPTSANVLITESVWLSPPATTALVKVANPYGEKQLAFEDIFICDPSQLHYGFSC